MISGEDLADVFYLTGLALPNTPKYRLAATVHVSGTQFKVDDLKGRLGSSDIAGRGQLETAGERPKLTATLSSSTLNILDMAPTLGRRSPTTTAWAAAAPGQVKPPPKSRTAAPPGSDATTPSPGAPPPNERLLPSTPICR